MAHHIRSDGHNCNLNLFSEFSKAIIQYSQMSFYRILEKGESHLSLSGLPAHQHYTSSQLCQSLLRCRNQPNEGQLEDPGQHELVQLQASHQKSDSLK